MRNIEIKARIKDLSRVESTARELCGPVPRERMYQEDTYFNVPEGRLKLREQNGGSELIYYQRPDGPGPKRCDYEIVTVGEPTALKAVLAGALGVRCIVRKRRTLFLYEKTRIHLDEVHGLGDFIEFEVVMSGEMRGIEGRAIIEHLMREFSVGPDDLVEGSYCELIGRMD